MAKPMSKSKIVSHMADKIGTPKRKSRRNSSKNCSSSRSRKPRAARAKFVIPNMGRGEGDRKARMGAIHRLAKRIKIKARQLCVSRVKSVKDAFSELGRFSQKEFSKYKRAGCIAVVENRSRAVGIRGRRRRFTRIASH